MKAAHGLAPPTIVPVPAVIPIGATVGGGFTTVPVLRVRNRHRRAAAAPSDEHGNKTSMTAMTAATGTGLGAGRKDGELSDGGSGRQASITRHSRESALCRRPGSS